MKRVSEAGFTLIGQIIGIGIIGILSALAWPVYTDYIVKSEIMEAVLLTEPMLKAAAVACTTGMLGTTEESDINDKLGFSPPAELSGKYTASIRAEQTPTGVTVWVDLWTLGEGVVYPKTNEFNYVGTCSPSDMHWMPGTTGSTSPLPSRFIPKV